MQAGFRNATQRVVVVFALVMVFGACQHNFYEDAIIREKDTEIPSIRSTEPAAATTIRGLQTLRVFYSEPVTGADNVANVGLSGAGLGTLALGSIEAISRSEYLLHFTGTMVDGQVIIRIAGAKDGAANELAATDLEFTSSAVPKWRYIGRAVSTNTLITSSAPSLQHDSQYLYAAFNEIACVNTFNDITVMRYEFSTGAWSVVGSRCIAGATATASSINPNLMLHNGTLFLAFTDGSVFDSVDQFVRVRAFRNGTWEVVGTGDAKIGGDTRNPFLVADGDNIYVSARDLNNSSKVSVYRNTIATPGAWTLMGTNGLSVGNTFRSAPMAFFTSELYIGFRDGGSTSPASKPSVLKWDGSSSWATSWQIDTLAADNLNLLRNGTELWAIYQQGGTSAVAVTKYATGAWSAAVTPNLSTEGTPNYLSAGIASGHTYAAYQVGTSSTCWVKRHDGTSWSALGTSFNCGNPTILLINSVVYAVFRDQDTGYMDRLSAAYFE